MEPIHTISQPSAVYPELQEEDEIRSDDGLRVSEAVYWEKYYEHPDFRYEWNNGVLEEVPVSDYLNIAMYVWFVKLLLSFLEVYPVGKLIMMEMGFRLALPKKITIRKPDLAIILDENPDPVAPEDRTFHGIYDLCIELISDATLKDIRRDTITKKIEYAAIGVREYFILDARGYEMAFYRRTPQGKYAPIRRREEEIIQSEVLPGFQFRIPDLYRQPPLKELVQDSVYQDFVLADYQAEKRRAEQAEHLLRQQLEHTKDIERQLAQERQRAEQERQRAERLAEKLRALGISPET